MPELAEVEVVRSQLERALLGSVVSDVSTDGNPRWTDAVLTVHCTVSEVRRRGKYVLLALLAPDGAELELVLHLGMTGVLSLLAPHQEPPERRRFLMSFQDGSRLLLTDVRGFGRATLLPRGEHGPVAGLARLGPEPLDSFDVTAFAEALGRRRGPVKGVLLEQSLMAGVGNYVADESLWLARVHPEERSLPVARGEELARGVIAVLRQALERGGLSMRDYQQADGSRGSMGSALRCYGRAGLPCERCGTPLVRSVVVGRGSTWCPSCQVAP